jgi:ferredoxin/flavodoxin
MIFYFSATGNSKYVAESIAKSTNDNIISIVSCIKEQNFNFKISGKENIGFITPVYFWGLPVIVLEFIERLVIEIHGEHYVYSIITCGTTTGFASNQLAKIFKNINLKVNARFSVKMVDTWTPIFDLSNISKNNLICKVAELQINEIIIKINGNITGNYDKRRLPIIAPIFYNQYKKARQTKHFWLMDNCIGCGACVQQCPIGAIEIKEKKVFWIKNECVMCLGCLHKCPKFAIQYGNKTQKHGQFVFNIKYE